jgi:2-polyprenyl-3-methyl-5-hydroxy-6-metoxy-1,4-benzoquinol methylase
MKKSIFERVCCDLCGSAGSVPYLNPVSSIGNGDDESRIVRCSKCTLLYTNPRPTQDAIAQCYEGYYGDTALLVKKPVGMNRMVRALWHAYCGQYLSEVLGKAHGKVLDVGCGTGDLLEELRNRGCEPYGVEFNPMSVDACRIKGLSVRCGNFVDAGLPKGFFDSVIFWHVLEHLPSPRKALDKAFRVLKPGGMVFIHSPNARSYCARLFGRYWYAWQLPFHFYHFDVHTIERLSRQSGFIPRKVRAVTPEYFAAHSLQRSLSGSKGAVRRFLYRPKLFYSLTFRLVVSIIFRIADTCLPRQGECLRVELEKSGTLLP